MIPHLLVSTGSAPPAPPDVGFLGADQYDIADLMPPMRDEVVAGGWTSSAPPAFIEDVPPGLIQFEHDDVASWMMGPDQEETFSGAWRSSGPAAPNAPGPPEPPAVSDVGIGVRDLPAPEVWEPNYASIIGRTPDVNAEFAGTTAPNDWTGISSPNTSGTHLDNYQAWFATRPTRRMDLALAMCPWKDAVGNQGVGLAEIPANISRFTTCANALAGFGLQGTAQRPIYIRLGWEMGSRGFPWATANDNFTANHTWMANYKSGFRLIVQTMRAAVPNNNWRFFWCPMNWNWNEQANPDYGLDWAEEIYPGDDVVDLVGMDHYDSSNQYPVPATNPSNALRQAVWDEEHLICLTRLNTFAVAHGKRQAFGEWGICHDLTGAGRTGGDNAIFIQKTYDWIVAHNSAVSGFEYVVYFNRIVGGQTEHSLTNFGTLSKINSQQTYIATFGQLPHPW